MVETFRDRVLAALTDRSMSKADLARRSGVPYHALDKYLKRSNAQTSLDNAVAIASALGINIDGKPEYEELRTLYSQLTEDQRKFLVAAAKGLLSHGRP